MQYRRRKIRGNVRIIIQAVIFAAGIALLILGIRHGELREIRTRGSEVCLECIGVG